MNTQLSFELVENIREIVSSNTRRTPVLRSEWLSALTGGDVFLKCENLQVTGSFKVRGGYAALALEHPAAVIAASAGNHGQGLARAARTFGIDCTIVVPRTVPKVKEQAIRRLGAAVIKAPADGYDDTELWMRDHLAQLKGQPISPFDHPGVIAGNGGTLALEIFEDLPNLDALVIPCGGGGCAIGAGLVARQISSQTRVIGVNSDSSPGMWMSRRDGRAHLKVESLPTIAEGIEGGVSETSFALAEEFIDEVLVVKEATIRRSVREFTLFERMIAEGSAVACIAAVLEDLVPNARNARICLVITGSNIDTELLSTLLREQANAG